MRFRSALVIAILGVILWGSEGVAQETGAVQRIEYPKWDVGTSIGLLGTSRRDFGGGGRCCENEPGVAWNLEAGRYLTPHWKLEAGWIQTNERRYWETVSTTSGTPYSYDYIERHVRPNTISGAVTYQFFENVFAHPYISAGIRINILSEDRQRYTYSGFYPPVMTDLASTRSTEVRPSIAFGFKSYFNRRVYIRPEILAAIDAHGVSHGTARLGIGFDF
jgi:hypothetical protein